MLRIILRAEFATFVLIFLGFIAGKRKFLGEHAASVLAKFVYYFSMPAVLFVAMANEPLNSSFNLPFIYAFGGSSLLIFVLGLGMAVFFQPEPFLRTNLRAFVMSSPNTAYMGLPVLVALFGAKAILPVAVATVLLIAIMAITIFINEVCQNQHHTLVAILGKVVFSIIKNPLIIAPLIGIGLAATNYHLPSILTDFCHLLGATAGPCALFAIGLSLAGSRILMVKSESLVVGIMKLLVQPVLMLGFIFLFHVDAFWAACGFVLAGLPIAAITYVVALHYKVGEQHIASLIFETTVMSILTLALMIVVVGYYWPTVLLKTF